MYEWAQRVWRRQFPTHWEAVANPDDIITSELHSFQAVFSAHDIQPPAMSLTRNWLHCRKGSAVNAEYIPGAHEVRVCLNLVKSPEDLRGAVARELAWLANSYKGIPTSDAAVARAVISSCRAEMSRCPELDPVSRDEGVRVCAQLYLKRKLPNRLHRQVDAWHFYTRRLVQENLFTLE